MALESLSRLTDSAIGSELAARPETSCCRSSTIESTFSWLSSTVVRTALRLVITSPISWSRSARACVSDDVEASRSWIVPDSPWNTLTIDSDNWLT